MIHEDRQTPNGAADAATQLAGRSVLLAAPEVDHAENGASHWESLYHRATPDQRQHLLALSREQGLLHADQLGDLVASAEASALAMLLQGCTGELQPVVPTSVQPIDAALDCCQREAVSLALSTPDLFLIQGWHGTGKSRVIAEIVHQVAARGQRVLVVAPSPPAIDRVLEQVGGSETVCAYRCLGTDETLETLHLGLRSYTLADRQRFFEEETLRAARVAVTTVKQQLERQAQDMALWPQLEELATQWRGVQEQHQQCSRQRAEAQSLIEEECRSAGSAPTCSVLQTRFVQMQQTQAGALAALGERLAASREQEDKTRSELAQLAKEQARLRPLAEARQQSRWWSVSYWRARFQSDLAARIEKLRQQQTELTEASERKAAEVGALSDEVQKTQQRHQAERDELVQAELTARLAELDARLADLNRLQQSLQTAVEQLSRHFPPETPALRDLSLAGIEAVRRQWQKQRGDWEEQMAHAQQWLADAERTSQDLGRHLQKRVNVVAGSVTALAGDPLFGAKAQVPVFEFLVVEEAEHITEADFQTLARRARRCILVGAALAESDESAADGRSTSAGTVRPTGLRSDFFAGLWRQLHTDPRRLPYAWVVRGGRLGCRLHPVPLEQQHWIQREHVADRPDIELCILSVPRVAPVLCEVNFPPGMGIHEAKAYLFSELEELTIQAQAPALHWTDRPGQVVLRLAAADLADARPVALDRGVCELVGTVPGLLSIVRDGPAPWQTCCLEFDCEAGWDRARAERWVEQRLKLRNLRRTMLLTTPHRMNAGLAQWISDVGLAGAYICAGPASCQEPAVDFVAVPAQTATTEGRKHSESESRRRGGGSTSVATRPRAQRGGAGLEVELGDPRRISALPVDLRPLLPAKGLVNYLEGQAVVRAVEALLCDPSFVADVSRWQQSDLRPGLAGRHPGLAVVALYPAQVELIRRLLRRQPQLVAPAVGIEVGLPGAFRQRECHTVLLSLTRSHTHRAVTFGEGPDELLLALTRPASRLVLFGDPGTLQRRGQWAGEVDHLDAPAAGRERQIINRLVRAMSGEGGAAQGFRVHEGGCL